MPVVNRVLDEHPVDALADYVAAGGGDALDAARRLEGVGIAEEVEAAGLRGRGGAGFPTGVKWRTVAASVADGPPPIVVVNGAEGEPGSFKDRTLLRRNPYRVLEGALIAASAVHARHVVVALKRSFRSERRRIAYAIAEAADAGWLRDVDVRITIGPSEYLFGEETALLEVIEGRQPFPRTAPPYREGLTTTADDQDSDNTSPGVGLVLANNVETLANVPGIVINGADWFRTLGTTASPGTVVCTVSGDTRRAGVAEFPMGTPVGEIIEEIGGGARDDRRIVAAISGVANAILPVELFDTPACYDAMKVGRERTRRGWLHRVRRRHRHHRRRRRRLALPRRRVVRAMRAVQARRAGGRGRARRPSPLRDRRRRHEQCARLARHDHRRRPLLPRHPAPGGRDEHPRPVPRIRRRTRRSTRCRPPTAC